MACAARHPERIAHLVICDSAAPKWGDTVFLFKDIFPETTSRMDALAFAEELGDRAAAAESFREYLSMLCDSPRFRDSMLAQPPARLVPAVNRQLNADLQRYDLNPELPRFRFPTRVITGRDDINVAPSVALKIHRAIPGSRLRVFERSVRLPFYEERDAFVSEVEGFLGR
jgi:proline iminopeptidase